MEKYCWPPDDGEYSKFPENSTFLSNATINSTCLKGTLYKDGDYQRTCVAGSNWTGQPLNCYVPDEPHPLANWPLIDCYGGDETSGFSSNLNLFNITYETWQTSSHQVAYFHGHQSSYAQTDEIDSHNILGASFTIFLFVKFERAPALIFVANAGYDYRTVGLKLDREFLLVAYMHCKGTGTNVHYAMPDNRSLLGDNAWLAYIFDDDTKTASLFMNGTELTSNYFNITHTCAAPRTLHIGRGGVLTNGITTHFKGSIGCFQMFNETLSGYQLETLADNCRNESYECPEPETTTITNTADVTTHQPLNDTGQPVASTAVSEDSSTESSTDRRENTIDANTTPTPTIVTDANTEQTTPETNTTETNGTVEEPTGIALTIPISTYTIPTTSTPNTNEDTSIPTSTSYVTELSTEIEKLISTINTTVNEIKTTTDLTNAPCNGVVPARNDTVHNFTEDRSTLVPQGTLIIYACLGNMTYPDGSLIWRLRCSTRGVWKPNYIPACKESPVVVRAKESKAIPVEAPAAAVVGTFGLGILLAIVGGIVLLDLATLSKHLKRMRRNIRGRFGGKTTA